MITVVTQTTAERNQETRELFNAIKPLLDDGYSYHSASVSYTHLTLPTTPYV